MLILFDLGQQARQAQSLDELAFLLCNATHALLPYRQAVLWLGDEGVRALSGVSQVEHNTPYLDWVKDLLAQPWASQPGVQALTALDLPAQQQPSWAEWWPQNALGLPLDVTPGARLLLARDVQFSEADQAKLMAWLQVWPL